MSEAKDPGPPTAPVATVRRPRPPMWRTPDGAAMIRRWASIVVIGVAGVVAWPYLRAAWRGHAGERQDALAARIEAARARVGDGLDPLLDAVAASEGQSVALVADFQVAPELGSGYDDYGCSQGFDDAFEAALGKDVVRFSIDGDRTGVALFVHARITPSGAVFQLPHAEKTYPGVAMDADMVLLQRHVHAQVVPAADIRFEHVTIGVEIGGMKDDDVAEGIMQGTCKEAGLALIEGLTTWKRPPPPPPPDPAAECLERGFRCGEHGRELEARDPATAAKLYEQGCQDGDDDACVRGGELVPRLPGDPDEQRLRAIVALELACGRELRGACAEAARVHLQPRASGDGPTDEDRRDALTLTLRACDLGLADACDQAAVIARTTPFAEAAPVLAGKVVASEQLGTIVALRWGQWTRMDPGQPTLWVTHPPAGLDQRFLVTRFTADELPAGITIPRGADAIYAVALDGDHGERCTRCKPGGVSDDPLVMPSLDCVCAVVPHADAEPAAP